MASANLDLVRSIYADWGRGDFRPVAWAHPEIEYVEADGPAPGGSKGVADMTERCRDFLSAWDDFRMEPGEFRELDGGRVLVLLAFGGRGGASGLSVGTISARGATIFHLCDGKVTRLAVYLNCENAFADLGIDRLGARNLEAIHAVFEEDARREYEHAFRIYDEEIAWVARSLPVPALSGVFHGHEGVRTFWRGWYDAWERIEILDGPHHRASGNQVVSWWRQRNRGKASGLEIEQDAAFVWTFQNGRIVRAALFRSHEDALEAAGLEQ